MGRGARDPWRRPADTYPARAVPQRVLAWAQDHLSSEIVAIKPVGGGRTDTISAIHLRDGEPIILRHVSVERWGEIGVAFVVVGGDASEEELIEFVRARLARFKAPKLVIFGELPKTSTGKIQKFVLRDRAD